MNFMLMKYATLLFSLLFFTRINAQVAIKKFGLPYIANVNSAKENLEHKSCLKVAPNGEIWIGFTGGKYGNEFKTSEYGAAKFDGKNWTLINKTNSPLPSNYIADIEFDGSTIWIATNAGLAKFSNNNWTIFRQSNSMLLSDSINDIHIDAGKIWIATKSGVSVLTGTQITNYTTQSGLIANRVNCIESTKKGELIFGTDSGISVFIPASGVWKTYDALNSGLKTNLIYALKTDIYDQVWIGSDSMLVNAADYYPAVYVMRDGIIKPVSDILSECTVKSDRMPYKTKGFASQNGKTIFKAAIKKYENYAQLLEYRHQRIKPYNLMNYQIYPPSTDYLFAYDDQDNIWFIAEKGWGDSLVKFTPSYYQDPVNDPKVLSYLSVNKVSTPVLGRGDMFWNLHEGGYEVPKGSCKTTLFAGTTWFGGIVNQDLKIAAQTYRQQGNDFQSGPLRVGLASTDQATIEKFTRFWNLSRYQIEEFKRNFAAGKVEDGTYKITKDILDWPAMGDTIAGFAKYLAPFFDNNQDGFYNPMHGDYPVIKGDQMIYWIYNDSLTFHSESEGHALGLEIHASAYAFACDAFTDNDSGSAINYTTFYHLTIFNRTTSTIDSFITGLWFDSDIGYYKDDYIGCNPKESYGFCYNGDDYDEFGSGYGSNPPAIAGVLLKGLTNEASSVRGQLNGFMYYRNDNTTFGNPVRPMDYWNYLNHRWKNGTPLTYGKGSTDTASFAYPHTDDLAGRLKWSEETDSMQPGDRNFLMPIGPVPFQANSALTLDYAIVYSRSEAGGAWASVEKLKKEVTKVKYWFNVGQFPSCYDDTKNGLWGLKSPAMGLTVFPNPGSDQLNIRLESAMKEKAGYKIYNNLGQAIQSGTLSRSGEINISGIRSGIYVIQITTPSNQSSLHFVISR